MSQKVSIIIPIYNDEKYLKQCLDSVVKQHYQNIEIILVNDGSTDGSLAICQRYQENDQRIHLIHQNHNGNSQARNKGISVSTGDLITFIDSDDFIDVDYVDKLVQQQERYNSDIAITMYRTFHEDVQQYFVLLGPSPADKQFNGCYNNLEWMKKVEPLPNTLAGSVWGKLFKRSLFDHVRFPTGVPFCEDARTLWQLELHANKISFINEVTYTYRTNRQNSTTDINTNSAIYWEFVNIQHRIANMKTASLTTDYLQPEYRRMLSQLRDAALIHGKVDTYRKAAYKVRMLVKYERMKNE